MSTSFVPHRPPAHDLALSYSHIPSNPSAPDPDAFTINDSPVCVSSTLAFSQQNHLQNQAMAAASHALWWQDPALYVPDRNLRRCASNIRSNDEHLHALPMDKPARAKRRASGQLEATPAKRQAVSRRKSSMQLENSASSPDNNPIEARNGKRSSTSSRIESHALESASSEKVDIAALKVDHLVSTDAIQPASLKRSISDQDVVAQQIDQSQPEEPIMKIISSEAENAFVETDVPPGIDQSVRLKKAEHEGPHDAGSEQLDSVHITYAPPQPEQPVWTKQLESPISQKESSQEPKDACIDKVALPIFKESMDSPELPRHVGIEKTKASELELPAIKHLDDVSTKAVHLPTLQQSAPSKRHQPFSAQPILSKQGSLIAILPCAPKQLKQLDQAKAVEPQLQEKSEGKAQADAMSIRRILRTTPEADVPLWSRKRAKVSPQRAVARPEVSPRKLTLENITVSHALGKAASGITVQTQDCGFKRPNSDRDDCIILTPRSLESSQSAQFQEGSADQDPIPSLTRNLTYEQRPMRDRIGDEEYARDMIAACRKMSEAKAATRGKRQATRIMGLLSVAEPATADDALYLTTSEAMSYTSCSKFWRGIIVTENQQTLALSTIGEFLEEYYDDNAKAWIQDPAARDGRNQPNVRQVSMKHVKDRFAKNQPVSDPWNLLELATHVEDGLRPAFLNNEDCRLLTKLKIPDSNEARRKAYAPGYKEIEKWALLAQAGALTEPHQDSHGYSTYITVNVGRVGFGFLSHPTDVERQAWRNNPFGYIGGRWRYVVLHPGQTVYFPAGTVHFVFRLPSAGDTLAFGGHVLRCSNIVHWARTVLEECRAPATTNEEITESAPGYMERVAGFVRQAQRKGVEERWGGKADVAEFLKLKDEFLSIKAAAQIKAAEDKAKKRRQAEVRKAKRMEAIAAAAAAAAATAEDSVAEKDGEKVAGA